MSKPTENSELKEIRTFDGIVYEHWSDSLEDYYHIHLPNGTIIEVSYEEGYGRADIREEVNGSRKIFDGATKGGSFLERTP